MVIGGGPINSTFSCNTVNPPNLKEKWQFDYESYVFGQARARWLEGPFVALGPLFEDGTRAHIRVRTRLPLSRDSWNELPILPKDIASTLDYLERKSEFWVGSSAG